MENGFTGMWVQFKYAESRANSLVMGIGFRGLRRERPGVTCETLDFRAYRKLYLDACFGLSFEPQRSPSLLIQSYRTGLNLILLGAELVLLDAYCLKQPFIAEKNL